jgi:outer membrane protein insertion porin family
MRFFALPLRSSAALLALVWLASCTGTGKLGPGERLYDGAKVKLSATNKEWKIKKPLKADLKAAVALPRPNKRFLWIRPKLSIYNTFHNRGGKNLGNFIADRFGEPPVLFNAKLMGRHQEKLDERAGNDGFFDVAIDSETKLKKKSARLVHRVQVRSDRALITGITYPSDSSELHRTILSMRADTKLEAGDPYRLEDLIQDRQRVADTLRNRGWYYFAPDHLYFVADTVVASPASKKPVSIDSLPAAIDTLPRAATIDKLDLRLAIKRQAGQKERERYRIGSVTVYPDYDLSDRQEGMGGDTLRLGCLTFVYDRLGVKPEVLADNIFLQCGEYFSTREYQATVYRLLNLNLYKFINLRFDVSPGADSLLDARLYLTPYATQRIDGNLSGVFSPNFYKGAEAGAAYTHRNTFRGAEEVRLSLNGAYLATNPDNYSFEHFIISDGGAQFSVPRFLFIREKQTNAFNTTRFSLRHEANYFRYNLEDFGRFGLSFQRGKAEGGYLWKKDRRGSAVHEINPLSFALQFSTVSTRAIKRQLVSEIPSDTTGTRLFLLTRAELRPNFTATVDQRLEPLRRYTIYFRQHYAVQAASYVRNKGLPDDYRLPRPLNIFAEGDFRQYNRFNGRHTLATRTAVSVGLPLKRNSPIALLDRYTIGGASSVRAFPPRSVGPGSTPRDTAVANILTVGQYTGNVLIEGSVEYRLPLGKIPELGFFVDAGNVWLTSGDDATEASKFRFNRFYKELALGAGAGFRLNLGFFLLRLDLAIPLIKPYLPEGQRWVGDDLDFGNKEWRKENMVWNFAFGYPF